MLTPLWLFWCFFEKNLLNKRRVSDWSIWELPLKNSSKLRTTLDEYEIQKVKPGFVIRILSTKISVFKKQFIPRQQQPTANQFAVSHLCLLTLITLCVRGFPQKLTPWKKQSDPNHVDFTLPGLVTNSFYFPFAYCQRSLICLGWQILIWLIPRMQTLTAVAKTRTSRKILDCKKLEEKNCVSDQTFSLTEGPSDDRRTCSGDPDPAPGDHDPCPDGSGSWGHNGTSPDPHSQQCGGGEEWDIPHTGQWSTGEEETHYCLIWEFSFLLRINILTCILTVNLLRCDAELINRI